MKRVSFYVILHIISIALLAVGVCVLIQNQLWFSAIVLLFILIYAAFHLYAMQVRHIEMMLRLIDSIRFNDMTLNFSGRTKNRMIKELADELSGVLTHLRKQITAEEVKHQYYENLLNKVDTAVLVADTNGTIEWMNRAAIQLLGQQFRLPEILDISPTTKTKVIKLERNGTTDEMAVSSTLFSTQGKESLLISLKSIHSVLEQNEMEAWQKLIRVLTHEIMNSITPIISLAETLSEREIAKDSEEKEYKIMLQAMQTIHRRSKGLLEFVENYRKLTQLPAPQLSLECVNDLFADLQKLFPDHEIQVIQPETKLYMMMDRVQIEQVLINLLKNAKEAIQKKGNPQITISATQTRDTHPLKMMIEDNGEGILPEVLDKIFVPFFTTKSAGSGIGLSLCKQIMNQHEGTIHVASQVGEGSCFTLTFYPRMRIRRYS